MKTGDMMKTDISAAAALREARRHYEEGVALRQAARFGEAINEFEAVIAAVRPFLDKVRKDAAGESAENAAEEMRKELLRLKHGSQASIDLINEIVFFVNADLMNP